MTLRLLRAVLSPLILLVTLWCDPASVRAEEEGVELARLAPDNWDLYSLSGKEIDAVDGDLVLRNRSLTAVIAYPHRARHASAVVRQVGGCLIDLTPRQQQNDQLICYRPGLLEGGYDDWSLTLDGAAASAGEEFLSATGREIRVDVHREDAEAGVRWRTTYILSADDPALTVQTTVINLRETDQRIPIQDAWVLGPEGDAEHSTAETPANWFYCDHPVWRQCYGVVPRSGAPTIRPISASWGFALQYSVESEHDAVVRPREEFSFERRIGVAVNRLQLHAALVEADPMLLRQVTLQLRDELKRGMQYADLELLQSGVSLGRARANRDGEVTLPLLSGDYQTRATHFGVDAGETPLHVGQPDTQSRRLIFNGRRPGTVNAEFTAEDGSPIACKVQFFGLDGAPTPDFGPVTAAFAVRNVRYTRDGKFVVELPQGEYDVLASCGPEHNAIRQKLVVDPGKNARVTGRFRRAVDTTGWTSCDLRGHTSVSGDNTATVFGRVLQFAAEDIRFAPRLEWQRVASYQTALDRLGLSAKLQIATGVEWTPTADSTDRWSIFPLPERQRPDPPLDFDAEAFRQLCAATLEREPQRMVIRSQLKDCVLAESVQADVLFDLGDLGAVWDALQTGADDESPSGQWLAALREGRRLTAVATTPSLSNFHSAGRQRTWVKADRPEEPTATSLTSLLAGFRSGIAINSNGPFLLVEAPQKPGESLVGASLTPDEKGMAAVKITVQCPNWLRVDTVRILVNGRPQPALTFDRATKKELFDRAHAHFEATVSVPVNDARFFIVAACGGQESLGPVMGPDWGQQRPCVISNPIYLRSPE